MSWLTDNATTLYILLGLMAAALLMIWRSNRQNKYLGGAVGALLLMGLIWVLSRFHISDSKQLEMTVQAMANAVAAGKVDDLFKHISNDFQYKGMTRDEVYEKSQTAIRFHKVKEVHIANFIVEELSRTKKTAKTRFRVSAQVAELDRPYVFVTQADFVLEAEQWKLKTMRFYNPLVDQDKEISLPGF
jgi:hypothetical protein